MRNLTEDFLAEMSGDNIRPAFLMEALFTSGWLRIWTGIGTITWNGYEWQGVGSLVELSTMSEATGIRADGIQAKLCLGFPNLPEDLAQIALEEVIQGAPATVYWALFDSSLEGWVMIDTPAVWFKGRVDIPTLEGVPGPPTISLSIENRMATFKRARGGLYSNEDQQFKFPGDLGLEFMYDLTQQGQQGRGLGTGVYGGTGRLGCFSGNVPVETAEGSKRFDELPDIVTFKDGRKAKLLVHDFSGMMLDMGDGELVTKEHLMKADGWKPAHTLFPDEVLYEGKIYNLHMIGAFPFDELCYKLTNGWTAHNNKEDLGGIPIALA